MNMLEDRLFRLMVESVSDHAIFAIDTEGRILSWNEGARNMFDYAPEEIIGQDFAVLFTPEDRQEGASTRELENAGDVGRAGDFRWQLRKDGSRIWASGFVNPLKDEAGNLIGYVKVARDATDRKRAEVELEEAMFRERTARKEAEDASHSKDEFIAVVSHELRSPLNAILGWTHILRQGRPSDEVYNRANEVIERCARTQSHLVEDLMDTARALSGKLRLESRQIDLTPVIEAAMEVVRPAADARGVSLNARLDSSAGQITGDPDRLQQVVWNLLSNAVKFTEWGGKVEIVLERIDPYVVISVRDTGRGIKAEVLPYVFDRYHQADASGARRSGGLGLGLSLVKQLVEMHGGGVTVESLGEGEGAIFTVKLPVSAVRIPEAEPPSLIAAHDQPLVGVRAIIVDDETDARELVQAVLELHGAQVIAFGSAQEALDLLTDESAPRPSVLISDLAMPDEDGLSLIRNLRGWERGRRGKALPAIALSAFGQTEDRTRALLEGFQLYLTKPVEQDELVMAIRSLTDKGTAPEEPGPREYGQ
jgi:PAS domain S-box-containing protein